jgi:RNA polymerase sigma factor (TIGR02999 family)
MTTDDITDRLIALRNGDRQALDDLIPVVYGPLREIARRRLRERGRDGTLDTTGLVHEAYLRLADQTRLSLNDRRHFFAVAAIAMRQILVDHARRKLALKRGGGARPLDLDAVGVPMKDSAEEIVSLDEALRRLSQVDERLARVVELRFFTGLTVEETADVLEIDPRTVKRDWRKARALLHQALRGPDG